jgi:protein-L-isoaspartate(D-aspartate) O-methyltransferase
MSLLKDWRIKPWRAAGYAEDRAPTQLDAARDAMIQTQLERRGMRDARVLAAMRTVPRHAFVPADLQMQAYEDAPLPIGGGQTISQPYMVAVMSAALKLRGDERVLEVGSGCGYQAAVLAKLAREVVTVEYRADLAAATSARLAEMHCDNIHVHCGDGTLGLPELAPFDAILVAAGAPASPPPLLEQLGESGRMVIPIGSFTDQELQLLERRRDTFQTTVLDTCRFVPLIGAHGWKDLPLR